MLRPWLASNLAPRGGGIFPPSPPPKRAGSTNDGMSKFQSSLLFPQAHIVDSEIVEMKRSYTLDVNQMVKQRRFERKDIAEFRNQVHYIYKSGGKKTKQPTLFCCTSDIVQGIVTLIHCPPL